MWTLVQYWISKMLPMKHLNKGQNTFKNGKKNFYKLWGKITNSEIWQEGNVLKTKRDLEVVTWEVSQFV